MKRIFIFLLSVMLVASVVSAMGEEFTIRNGLKWGDTPEIVLQSEELKSFDGDLPSKDSSIERKTYNKAMVAGHPVEAIFGFKDGKLASVEYEISSTYFAEIISALKAKYGDAFNQSYFQSTPYYECAQNMYKQYLGSFTSSTLMVRLDYWWILDDGTIITACSTKMYGSDPYVAYIDSSSFETKHDFSGL